ncbi:hypothetical protein ACN28S_67345 [Cystobacter fuscus]
MASLGGPGSGEPARLESRALAIAMPDWDEEDGEELPFEFIAGTGRYHAIVGTDPIDIGAEMQIAEALSLECDERVYSIERANDPWTVMSWRNGALDVLEDADPDSLAEALGCPLPGSESSSGSPARKPLRKVALVEGVLAHEAPRVLEAAEDPFLRDTTDSRTHSAGCGSPAKQAT